MVTATRAAYLGFLALLALERMFELRLSKRNAAKALAHGAVEVGQRHYRVMVALHTSFLIACALEVVLLRRAFPGALGVLALAGALFAQGLRYWAIRTLGERWNTRIIVSPTLSPVTGGPYRYLRHPNYVAVVAEGVCVPLVHGAFFTALGFTVLNAALLRVRIRAEERALGPRWAEAFADKPRFVPELERRHGH